LLDEAISTVDPALDVTLRGAIDRLTAGRTSVTLAHRLATAEAADDVLVFDQGRMVERGSHVWKCFAKKASTPLCMRIGVSTRR